MSIQSALEVDGNGANLGKKELVNVGVQAGMKKQRCVDIVEEIQGIVEKYMYDTHKN